MRVATREITANGSLRVKVYGQLHACKEVSERDKRELPANWKSPALGWERLTTRRLVHKLNFFHKP